MFVFYLEMSKTAANVKHTSQIEFLIDLISKMNYDYRLTSNERLDFLITFAVKTLVL